MKKILLPATLSLALPLMTVGGAQAQSVTDVADSVLSGWGGYASFGATMASGNSESQSISGAIRLGKTVDKWEHLLYGSIMKGSASSVQPKFDETNDVIKDDAGQIEYEIVTEDNSNRINIGYQPKFYWRPKTYFFGLLDWEADKPANIDTATRQIIGVGHKFYSNASGFLSGELGIGNKTTELHTVNQGQDSEISGGIGYLGLNYLNRFNEMTTFNADLRSDFGSEATFIELGLGLAFKISNNMALKISHFVRSNGDITDLRNTDDNIASLKDSSSDSVTTFNLVVDI